MTDEPKPALTLDCIGLYCPEPLFQTRESIDSIEVGETLEVFADDPAAEEDLTRFAKRAGHEVVWARRDGGELHILLRRLH
jgi:tRNA 2-thiouridine synthesizing protein A